jgi:hypothetical protein
MPDSTASEVETCIPWRISNKNPMTKMRGQVHQRSFALIHIMFGLWFDDKCHSTSQIEIHTISARLVIASQSLSGGKKIVQGEVYRYGNTSWVKTVKTKLQVGLSQGQKMQDFENFVAAARMIFSGGIPYGKIAFFAPSWTAIWIYPFVLMPEPFNQWMWQFATIVAIAITCILTVPKSRLFPMLVIFSPPSLLTLVAGQLSAFVALASTGLLLEVTNRRRTWVLLACAFVALSKPHLAALPIAITLITLMRKKESGKAVCIVAFFIGLGLAFEVLVPHSTLQWVRAMFSGDYKTGDIDSLQHVLLSSGTRISIGTGYFQGSIFFFIPFFIMYLYVYFKESLTPRTIALTLSIIFVILPYYRLYDFTMLIYAVGVLYQGTIALLRPHQIAGKPTDLLKPHSSPSGVRI